MASNENRSEARIRSRGQVTLLAQGVDQIPAVICDISLSGLSLQADRGLARGTEVVIDGLGFVGEGVVRYCECLGAVFRIGVQLRPVDASPG